MNNLCENCNIRGLCCFHSTFIDNTYDMILPNHPCPYLNIKNGLCTIYNQRNKIKNCDNIEDAIQNGSLPIDCLYVKDNEEYKNNMPKILAVPRGILKWKITLENIEGFNNICTLLGISYNQLEKMVEIIEDLNDYWEKTWYLQNKTNYLNTFK